MSIPSWLSNGIKYPGAQERKLGSLPLPSGQIVACDPLVSLDDTKPLARSVPPGSYAVHAGLAGSDVVYARIDFGGTPVKWEPSSVSKDGSVLGYPVDAGVGCFVDATIAAAAADAIANAADEDPILLGIRSVLGTTRPAGMIPVAGSEMSVFRSGEGDGVYASYWGLTSDGRPATLVTEFLAPDDDEDAADSDDTDDTDDSDDDDPAAPAQPAEGVSPYFEAALRVLRRLKAEQLIETTSQFDEEAAAEAIVEAWTVGSDVAEALMEQPGVDELYATDADLHPTR